jgi:hypothetical protein
MIPDSAAAECVQWVADARGYLSTLTAWDGAILPQLDPGLELASVYRGAVPRHLVALLLALLHPVARLRRAAVAHIAGLGVVLWRHTAGKAAATREDERGYEEVAGSTAVGLESSPFLTDVHVLLAALLARVAPRLALVAAAVVAELEGLYAHPNIAVQQIAIVATTCFIECNPDLFVVDTHRAVGHRRVAPVWALVYRLDAEPPRSEDLTHVGSRTVVARSLLALSALYCEADRALTAVVLGKLLAMPDKSASEVAAAKECISAILGHYAAQPDQAKAALLEVFARAITVHSECQYDLLGWGLAEALRVLAPPPSAIVDFVTQLLVHFRALPDLVRAGAAICLSAVLPGRIALLKTLPELRSYIVSGCLDSSLQVQLTYLGLLRMTSSDPAVAQMVDRVLAFHGETIARISERAASITQTDDSAARARVARAGAGAGAGAGDGEQPEGDEALELSQQQKEELLFISGGEDPFEEQLMERPSVLRILRIAVKEAPEAEPGDLMAMLNALKHLPRARQYRQMELIALWCSRATHIGDVFVESFLPMLVTAASDPPMLYHALGVLRAMCPALSSSTTQASSSSSSSSSQFAAASKMRQSQLQQQQQHQASRVIDSVDAYMTSFMRRVTDDTLFARAAAVIPSLPYLSLHVDKSVALLSLLVQRVCSLNPALRVAVYRCIGRSAAFWKTKELLAKALAALLLALGDSSPTCVAEAVQAIECFRPTCGATHRDIFRVHLPSFNLDAPGSSYARRAQAMDELSLALTTSALVDVKLTMATMFADPDLVIVESWISAMAPESPTAKASAAAAAAASSSSDRGSEKAAPIFAAVRKRTSTSNVVEKNFPLLGEEKDQPPPQRSHPHLHHQQQMSALWPAILAIRHSEVLYPGLFTDLQVRHIDLVFRLELVSPMVQERLSTCQVLRRMLFLRGAVVVPVYRHLVSALSEVILDEKYAAKREMPESSHWLLLQSAYNFLVLACGMQLPGFGRHLVRTLMDRTIEVIETEPLHLVKVAALELVEALVIMVPNMCSPYFERLRDTLRLLFCFPNRDLDLAVRRVYPLLYLRASALPALAEKFHHYLVADLRPVVGELWEASADPLLSKLTPTELRQVIITTLRALGCLRVRYLAMPVLKEVLPFLTHPDRDFRLAALEATHTLVGVIPAHECPKFMWVALASLLDQHIAARLATHRLLSMVDPLVVQRVKGLPSERYDPLPEDKQQPGLSAAESGAEALPYLPSHHHHQQQQQQQQQSPLDVAAALLVEGWGMSAAQLDAALVVGEVVPLGHRAEPAGWNDAPHGVMDPPEVTGTSLAALHAVVVGRGLEDLAAGDILETSYYIAELVKIPSLSGPALLVLSELWRFALSKHPGLVDTVTIIENLVASVPGITGNSEAPSSSSSSALLSSSSAAAAGRPHGSSQGMMRAHASVHACALAVRNVAMASSEAFREAVARVSSVAVPSFAELVVLLYLVPVMAGNPTDGPALAKGLVRSFVGLIETGAKKMEPNARRALHELMGELACIAGGDELVMVLQALASFSGQSARDDLSDITDAALGRIIDSTGRDSEAVQAVMSDLFASLQSAEPAKRTKATFQLKVFARFLTLHEMISVTVPLLCDPIPLLREKCLEILLAGTHPPLANQVRTSAQALLASKNSSSGGGGGGGGGGGQQQKNSALQQNLLSGKRGAKAGRHLAGADGGGLSSRDWVELKGPLRLPMPEIDPLNRQYRESRHFQAFLDFYGLRALGSEPAAAASSDGGGASGGGLKRLNRTGSRFDLFSEARTEPHSHGGADDPGKEAILENPAHLVRNIIRLTADRGAPILESFREFVAECLGRGDRPPDRDLFHYKVTVLSNILVACDGLRTDLAEYAGLIKGILDGAVTRCAGLRAKLFAVMEHLSFHSALPMDVPATQEHYEMILRQRKAQESAGYDREAREAMTREKQRLEAERDSLAAELRDLTFIVVTSVSALGTIYDGVASFPESELVVGLRSLMSPALLGDDHRGVRLAARSTSAALWSKRLAAGSGGVSFRNEAQAAADGLWAQLDANSSTGRLGRRALDLLEVLVALTPFLDNPQLRGKVINLTLDLFDSTDGALRRCAFQAIRSLVEANVPEALQAIKSGRDTPARLMSAITSRLADPSYLDKEALNDLLKWFFARRAEEGMNTG